jgi:hypothetical protein
MGARTSQWTGRELDCVATDVAPATRKCVAQAATMLSRSLPTGRKSPALILPVHAWQLAAPRQTMYSHLSGGCGFCSSFACSYAPGRQPPPRPSRRPSCNGIRARRHGPADQGDKGDDGYGSDIRGLLSVSPSPQDRLAQRVRPGITSGTPAHGLGHVIPGLGSVT